MGETEDLAGRVMEGDRSAVAKAITMVENGDAGASKLLQAIGGKTGRAFILGITGAPGTGKSTLVDAIVGLYRKAGVKVGVIAVDPTSPITGGALLGDRVRMVRHTLDAGVYIRSVASRGSTGGLSGAVSEVIQVLDASGAELIVIETVGIGQSDVEIMKVAHAVMVITMPGLGDEVQASKGGLMEIGDIYVVNKSDLPGADAMVISLMGTVRDMKRRSPPVLKASGLHGDGMEKLYASVETLRDRFRSPEGREMRLRSVKGMMLELAKKRVVDEFEERARGRLDGLSEKVADHEVSLEDAVKRLSRT